MVLSSPRYIDSVIAGPEGAKNQRGKVLRLIQIRFSDGESAKNRAHLSRQFATAARIADCNSTTAVSLSSQVQQNAFRRPDAHRQSRSFALQYPRLKRSPQLHPALLRLSAMMSQSFTARSFLLDSQSCLRVLNRTLAFHRN